MKALNWLLPFVPIAIALKFLAPERYLLVFLASSLAILPLAASPKVEEVAATIIFLASPENKATQGAVVPAYGKS